MKKANTKLTYKKEQPEYYRAITILSNSENCWDRLCVGKDREDSKRLSNSQHGFVKNELCDSEKTSICSEGEKDFFVIYHNVSNICDTATHHVLATK